MERRNDNTASPKRRRKAAAGVGASLFAAAAILLGVMPAIGQDLQSEHSQKEGQLSQAKEQKGELSSTIADYSAQISTLAAEVANLRNQEAEAEAELRRDTARLKTLRVRLARSIKVLELRLDDIYRSGEPDMVTVILDSDGFDDLLERVDYLDRIRTQDERIVSRVRDLRNEMELTVARVRAERDKLAKARAGLEAKESALASARAGKQQALAGVNSNIKRLEGDLSDLSAQIQEQLAGYGGTLPAGPIRGGAGGFIWPVNGPVVSPFGMRWGRLHAGIDIAVPSGTPIRASKSGSIVLASYYGGYGNYTCINHGGGISTCYAHQSSYARTGGSVSQGQVIGYVGCTGHCYGPHLHFEVRVNGVPQNPLNYL